MLQQTTVGAARKRYPEFVRRFPDLPSLARVSEDSVLAAWSGLGYYARARNLRRAARAIVGEHGGAVPRDPAILRRLPGFGEYMSAVVASLAFGARLPAADANVERVLSRAFALQGTAGSRRLREEVLGRAASLLPARRPGDLTAALMDLGQLVCTPRRPSCPACPIARHCEATRLGTPERFPRRRPKPEPIRLSLAAAVAEKGGRVLLVRRRSTWLDGMWEFPSAEAASPEKARRALALRLGELRLELSRSRPVGKARHSVANRRIEIAVYRAGDVGNGGPPSCDARWFRATELPTAPVPTLTRKIAVAALGSSPFGSSPCRPEDTAGPLPSSLMAAAIPGARRAKRDETIAAVRANGVGLGTQHESRLWAGSSFRSLFGGAKVAPSTVPLGGHRCCRR